MATTEVVVAALEEYWALLRAPAFRAVVEAASAHTRRVKIQGDRLVVGSVDDTLVPAVKSLPVTPTQTAEQEFPDLGPADLFHKRHRLYVTETKRTDAAREALREEHSQIVTKVAAGRAKAEEALGLLAGPPFTAVPDVVAAVRAMEAGVRALDDTAPQFDLFADGFDSRLGNRRTAGYWSGTWDVDGTRWPWSVAMNVLMVDEFTGDTIPLHADGIVSNVPNVPLRVHPLRTLTSPQAFVALANLHAMAVSRTQRLIEKGGTQRDQFPEPEVAEENKRVARLLRVLYETLVAVLVGVPITQRTDAATDFLETFAQKVLALDFWFYVKLAVGGHIPRGRLGFFGRTIDEIRVWFTRLDGLQFGPWQTTWISDGLAGDQYAGVRTAMIEAASPRIPWYAEIPS